MSAVFFSSCLCVGSGPTQRYYYVDLIDVCALCKQPSDNNGFTAKWEQIRRQQKHQYDTASRIPIVISFCLIPFFSSLSMFFSSSSVFLLFHHFLSYVCLLALPNSLFHLSCCCCSIPISKKQPENEPTKASEQINHVTITDWLFTAWRCVIWSFSIGEWMLLSLLV